MKYISSVNPQRYYIQDSYCKIILNEYMYCIFGVYLIRSMKAVDVALSLLNIQGTCTGSLM